MKKKKVALNGKLMLHKSVIVELTASQQALQVGGDDPVQNSNTQICTSIPPTGQTAVGSMCNPQFTNECQTRAGQLGCQTAAKTICTN